MSKWTGRSRTTLTQAVAELTSRRKLEPGAGGRIRGRAEESGESMSLRLATSHENSRA
jgi:hypothetical protein